MGIIDAAVWQDWKLRYGPSSQDLREAIAALGWWLANTYLPWAAYLSIIADQFISLEKCPGVHLVVIGYILQSMMGKCYLIPV